MIPERNIRELDTLTSEEMAAGRIGARTEAWRALSHAWGDQAADSILQRAIENIWDSGPLGSLERWSIIRSRTDILVSMTLLGAALADVWRRASAMGGIALDPAKEEAELNLLRFAHLTRTG